MSISHVHRAVGVILAGTIVQGLVACSGGESPTETAAGSMHPLSVVDCPAGYHIVEGTAGPDVLYGTPGNDCILGLGGDDRIEGRGGQDVLIGGLGNDVLIGGGKNDRLCGEAGDDDLRGGAGDDLLDGGDGDDALDGGSGNDRTLGGAGNDSITGDAGDDSIDAGAGDDSVDGGAGDDEIDGGGGNDTIDGAAGDDVVDAGAGNDRVAGGGGTDTLHGGDGDDRIDGGGGDDVLLGDAGDDYLFGGAGQDDLRGGAGDDVLDGGAGNDTLNGDDGNDVLIPGAGKANVIDGGAGNDACGGTGCEAPPAIACTSDAACTAGRHCATELGVCIACRGNAECDDADACNGVERCEPTNGCVAGTPSAAPECVAAPPFFEALALAGSHFGSANAISADGRVVVGDVDGHGVRWTEDASTVELAGMRTAQAVNADGSVIAGVGGAKKGASTLLRWTAAGGTVGLSLPGTVTSANVAGVSADGAFLIGNASIGKKGVPFRWTEAAGVGTFGCGLNPDCPVGKGQVLGTSASGAVVVGSDSGYAMRWDGSFFESQSAIVSGAARAISQDGRVIVGSAIGDTTLAYRFAAGNGVVRLGTLPGGLASVANATNGDGSVVVGESDDGSASHATVWDAVHGLRKVADLLTQAGVAVGDLQLVTATGVSNDGRVVIGNGTDAEGMGFGWVARLPVIAAAGCETNPCQHGSCENVTVGYACACPPGFVGIRCETPDSCASNPCIENATCTDQALGRTCACPRERGGPSCGTDLDECSSGSSGCDPLTACLNVWGGHACSTCPPGYGGDGETGCVPGASSVERMSIDADGTQADGFDPSISADGLKVAFTSLAPLLGAPGWQSIFVKDRTVGALSNASTTADGEPANAPAFTPVLSGDARYVVFVSSATNLVSGAGSVTAVFRKDLVNGTVSLVSAASDGAAASGPCSRPSISHNGQRIAMRCAAANFPAGDRARVYVKDMASGALRLAEQDADGTIGTEGSDEPALSPDGRYVAFWTPSNNLHPDLAGAGVLRKDLESGVIEVVSTANDGSPLVDAHSPSLSTDGRYVAFTSDRETPGVFQIYRRDAVSHTTLTVSRAQGGDLGDASSVHPQISADGATILLTTSAHNLIPRSTTLHDAVVYEATTHTFRVMSSGFGGSFADQDSTGGTLSRDSRSACFSSAATNLVAGDTNGDADVFCTPVATTPAACADSVAFEDAALEAAVRSALGGAVGPVTPALAETLTALDASARGITSLRGLECFTNLATLALAQNQIRELEPLSNLKHLQLLSLHTNQIRDLTPLAGLRELFVLDLGSNQLRELNSLAHLPSLFRLFLASNRIVDVGPLAELPAIAALDLAANTIVDVSSLTALESLTTLDLSGNRIVDVGPLGEMTNLVVLSLGRNSISDITALAGLSGLTWLDVSFNDLSSITALGSLQHLEAALVLSNRITDLGPLATLPALAVVRADSNGIEDISPLVANSGIGTGDIVSLGGNPVDCVAQRTSLLALVARGVSLQSDCVLVGCVDADGDGLGDGTGGNVACPHPGTDRNDLTRFICSDIDGDLCDDCASGTFDTANDGFDADHDGICSLSDPSVLVLAPNPLDFAGVPVGASISRTISVSNQQGDLPLFANLVPPAGLPFYLIATDCPGTLASHTTCHAEFLFAPTARGATSFQKTMAPGTVLELRGFGQ